MQKLIRGLPLMAFLLPLSLLAQPNSIVVPPQPNILNLSAAADLQVAHDQIVLTLSVTREAPQAPAVQEQLRVAVEQALGVLRPLAQEGQMAVRTGGFSVQPRYGREGRIQCWAGTAEVILEGRDIPRISRAAARADSMSVGGVSFGLSPELLRSTEASVQQQAIQRFRAKAGELARGFGFSEYELRDVTVQSADAGPGPRPRMMAMEAKAAGADAAAVPVEPGKTTVTVTVSGSVQMRGAAAR
jgi:predicted secreted protein